MSTTFPAKSSACLDASWPRRMRGYSCKPEPQPAALVTMASRSPGKLAKFRFACFLAAFQAPTCQARAPQQPCSLGTSTSTPLRARQCRLAWLISGASATDE